MNPIKFGDFAKIEPQQYDTATQQPELAAPATQGEAQKPVTLMLYIEEVRPDGSVISVSAANVTGQDGAGNNFQKTTDDDSYMTINGTSGNWSFIAFAPGYVPISWSQPITHDHIEDAFLQPEASRNGQLHDPEVIGPGRSWQQLP